MNGFLGMIAECAVNIYNTIKAYQNGERRPLALYSHFSGLTQKIVDVKDSVDSLNNDMNNIFSDKPLRQRILPSIRIGLLAVSTAIVIHGSYVLTTEAVGLAKLTNYPIPARIARVVTSDIGESTTTLGKPGISDVFVTAADDIAGISNSSSLTIRLGLINDSGNFVEGPFTIFEFDTPASGLASPIFRTNPGFVGNGLTSGGAREYVIPNMSLDLLVNLVTRIVP